MPETLAGQPEADASTPEVPAAQPAADIEKLRADLTAQFDARIAGFQSKVVAPRDEMIAALRAELDELKTSGLSEDEREQLAVQKLTAERDALLGKLELAELAPKFSDEMSAYERLIAAKSAEEQLQILRDYKAPPAAPAAPAAPAEVEIPDTDPNRPARTAPVGGVALPDGTYMTDALADRILNAVPGPMAEVTQARIRPTD